MLQDFVTKVKLTTVEVPEKLQFTVVTQVVKTQGYLVNSFF